VAHVERGSKANPMGRRSIKRQREKAAVRTARDNPWPTTPATTREPYDAMSAARSKHTTQTVAPAWSGVDWMTALALLAILFLAYYPALRGTPLWDDNGHLTKPELRSWAGLARIWFEVGATQQYYPLTHSAFWLEYRLWGDWYPGYHLTNVLLHAASAVLLVRILRHLEIRGAWLAAALWALHPVQVESVAWMSELKNTLSGVFYFGSALCYLHFDRKRTPKVYFTALGLFILGLLSKSVIDTLPAALLLLFYSRDGKLLWRRDARPLIPFFAAGIVSGLFTAWVEHAYIGANGNTFHFSALERSLIAGRAFWFYLGKLIWPADLIFSYPRWQISASEWWQFLFPISALALVAILVRGRQRWGREPAVAVLYFAGTLFPALGFVNIYPFRYSFVADHFQYLASVGPLVLTAAGITMVFDAWPGKVRFLRLTPGAVLAGVLGLLTWRQCHMYADIDTLWRVTLARNPLCWMAYSNLGNTLLQEGRTDEAIVQYEEALRINPDYANDRYNLGSAFLEAGRVDEAIAQYREAVRVAPKLAEAHFQIGNALVHQGRMQEAVAEYGEALTINPDYADAHGNLGIAMIKEGRTDEGIAHVERALELRPGDAGFQNTVATVAWMLATAQQASPRNGARALELATRASLASGGKNPAILRTLAAAQAETGDFTNAIQTAQTGLQLARGQNNASLVEELRREINRYETGQPVEKVR
jgi:tetratricopeptide (TPR) repeat protein